MANIFWDVINPFIDIGILLTLLGCAYVFGGWKNDVEYRIKNIEKPIGYLILLHKDEFIDQYMEFWGTENKSNPHTDKGYLLRKLKDSTITYEESIRLQAILEDERRIARERGSTGGLLAIGALLLLIAIFIDSLSEE